jgi:hypothetical protein
MTGTEGGRASEKRTGWGVRTPATTLLLVAPLIGEVLNGATRVSFIFVFVLQIMVWGCGALMIREIVHRWKGGWTSVTLLGLVLSAVVELLVLQTSLAPIPWLEMMSIPTYGRTAGVNWPWFVFMLGYEAVWIVLVPILITELIFPAERHEAWLRPRGLAIAAVVFSIGSLMLWALWTQVTVPIVFKVAKYTPPLSTLMLSVLLTIVLVVGAYLTRTLGDDTLDTDRRAPAPWVVGLGAAALAFPWWGLIVIVFAPQPALPLWVPMLAGTVWAIGAFALIRRWSAGSGWSDRHRWALAFSTLLVCMLAGYLGSNLWPLIDLIGKIVLNIAAAAYMIRLARVVWQREPSLRTA